jgi:DNA polymerase III subunit beta
VLHDENMEGFNMKLTMNAEKLNEGLTKVSKVISNTNTIPILTGIKFVVTEKEIQFVASNTNETIFHTVPVDGEEISVDEGGQVVLPRDVMDLAKKAKGAITLTLSDNWLLTATFRKSEFEFNCMDAEEFPRLQSLSDKPLFKIKGTDFFELIGRTHFCAAESELRPILTGVLLKAENGLLTITATDSFRLSMVKMNCDCSQSFQAVIPALPLSNILKNMDPTEDMEIYVSDTQFSIKTDSTLYLIRLLDGTYPDVSRLISTNHKTKMRIDRNEFLEGISLVETVAASVKNDKKKSTIVKMHVNGVASLSASQATKKGKIDVPYNEMNGEELDISFSARYFIQSLKSLSCKEVEIDFDGGMRPMIIRPVGSDHMETVQLILPVRNH